MSTQEHLSQASRVTLRDITHDNWREALALKVSSDHLRFLSETPYPVALALAKAYIQPNGVVVAPMGIYTAHTMVGFFALAYARKGSNQYTLIHFLIDQRHQRQGYGAAAIHALVALLQDQHPACRTLSLTVHPDNDPAQRLYKGCGFQETGTVISGEPCYHLSIPVLRPTG